MCLSQPSSLYQRCFLFPLLKGPGFPAVFLENFPIFEGFLRAKCFPTVKARAQGCKKTRRQTHTPGKNTCDRTLQICIKHATWFSQWYVPVLFFFLPGGPGEEPLEFLPPECFNGVPWGDLRLIPNFLANGMALYMHICIIIYIYIHIQTYIHIDSEPYLYITGKRWWTLARNEIYVRQLTEPWGKSDKVLLPAPYL